MRELPNTLQRSLSGSSATGDSFNSSTSHWLGSSGSSGGLDSRPQNAASSATRTSRERRSAVAPETDSSPRNNELNGQNNSTGATGVGHAGDREASDLDQSLANTSGYFVGSSPSTMTSPRKVLRRNVTVPGLGVFELSAEWSGERLYATEPRLRADSGTDRSSTAANGKRANAAVSTGSGSAGGGSETRSMLSRLTSFAASGASMMGLGGSSQPHGANAGSSPQAPHGSSGSTSSSPSLTGESQGVSPMAGFLGIGGPVLGRRINYGWGARGTQVSALLIPRAVLSMMLMNAIVENASVMASNRRTFSADGEMLILTSMLTTSREVNGRRTTAPMQSAATMDHPRAGTPPPNALTGNSRERRGLFGRRRAASARSLEASNASGNEPTTADNDVELKAQARSRVAPELMALDLEPLSDGSSNAIQDRHVSPTASGVAGNGPMMGWLNRWTSKNRDKAGSNATRDSCLASDDSALDTLRATAPAGQRLESLHSGKPETAPLDLSRADAGIDDSSLNSNQASELVPLLLLNYRDQVYIIRGDGHGRVLQKFRFRALPTCHELCLSASEDTVLAIIGFANGEVLVHRDPLRSTDGGYECIGVPSPLASAADQPKQVMVMALAVTSGRDRLITARGNGSIYIHALPTGLGAYKGQTVLLAQIPSQVGITSVSVWQHLLACTSRDGMLRLYAIPDRDGRVEQSMVNSRYEPLAAARSHYGALLCAAWSPDGRFLATGGEDDTLTIWRVPESASEVLQWIVRGRGHSSFVTSLCWFPTEHLAWDDLPADSPERDWSLAGALRSQLYHLASVGQDGNLCIWELDLDALPAPGRTRRGQGVPEIEPVLRQTTHHDGLTCIRLACIPSCALLVTADEAGTVRLWEAAAAMSAQHARDRSSSWSEGGLGTGAGSPGSPGSPTQRIEYLLNAHGLRGTSGKLSDREAMPVS